MGHYPLGLYALSLLPLYLLFCLSLHGLFEKAGLPVRHAWIPGWNLWQLLKVVRWHPAVLLFFVIPYSFPFAWLFLMRGLARKFGRANPGHLFFAYFLPFIWLPWLAFSKKAGYEAAIDRKTETRFGKEVLNTILLGLALTLVVNSLFVRVEKIPTPSMESTLMVGDRLLVSKLHYGPRLPMTPLSLPFFHNHIPGTQIPTFLSFPRFPYGRLPGFSRIQRNDIVVFNYPFDDLEPDGFSPGEVNAISQKQTYVKRCVGMPGDLIRIWDGELQINGQSAWEPPGLQLVYEVNTRFPLSPQKLENAGFRVFGTNRDVVEVAEGTYHIFMRPGQADTVGDWDEVLRIAGPEEVENAMKSNENVFPRSPANYRWDLYNFGVLKVPARGDSVKLDAANLAIYERIIRDYEGHDFGVMDGEFWLDGERVSSYVFEKDYYFMMGDNRYNSMDSRYWGFVPEDHIIGKPLMVLFSMENGELRAGRWLAVSE